MKRYILSIILVLVLNVVCFSQWQPIGPYGGKIMTIASSGNNVAVSTYGSGIFTSSNNGNTWIFAVNGLTSLYTFSLCYSSNTLYAGTSRGIFQSSNNGLNWVQNSLNSKSVNSILINGNYFYAGTYDSGVYISSNSGINWLQSNTGMTYKNVNALLLSGSYIFAATNGGVYISLDNGSSWTPKIWGLGGNPVEMSFLAVVGTNIFTAQNGGGAVMRSTNYGNNWYPVSNGLPSSYSVSILCANGNNLYAGTCYSWGYYNEGLYMSTNSGNSWNNFDNGQLSGISSGICFSGQNIFVSSENEYLNPSVAGKIFRSTNNGLNWMNISDGVYNLSVSSIVNIGSYIFTGYDGIYVSSNSGGNWNQLNSPSIKRRIKVLTASGTNLYAGTEDSCIYVSSNYGATWTHITSNSYPYFSDVSALGVSGRNIFAGIHFDYLNISSNNGNSWRRDTAIHATDAMDILVSGINIFAGFYSGGIYRSTNNGLNWTKVINGINPSAYCMGLAKDGENIYACFYWGNGIYMSTNNGDNWVKISNEISNLKFSTIAAYESKIFVGADSVIYYSSNFGANWIKIYQGLASSINLYPLINKLYITNGYIYATTNQRSVWRRPLSDFVGIQNISIEIPNNYSLGQNYPNPFNPTTKIKFDVILDSHFRGNDKVVLKVYDVMGREVQTLVNESLKSGTYEVSFDGSQLTSGVYFYKLITGGFTETKKMLLLK
ncbi:MAG: T9SS type A sorting domain-containing protein [Ignavibacteriae bacterium]|nr:T9SS type A sorting domain-containing protein [Ignavibacteriota bacterium]